MCACSEDFLSFRSTSRFANVLSRFANVLGQFPNFFYLINGLKNEVYTRVSDFYVSWRKGRGLYMCNDRFVSKYHLKVNPKYVFCFVFIVWRLLTNCWAIVGR